MAPPCVAFVPYTGYEDSLGLSYLSTEVNMKLEILGDKSNISSAYFEVVKNGLHQLVINTHERYPELHNRGSSLLFVTQYPDTRVPEHVCFEVLGPLQRDGQVQSDDSRYDQRTEVVLVAETPAEEEILRGIPYENFCKTQLLVLFVSREGLEVGAPLVSWREEAAS